MLDQPCISLVIGLNENFKAEYRDYIADPDAINSIPVEYYEIVWQSFCDHPLAARAIPLKSVLIDPSSISNMNVANRYVLEIIRDYLDKAQALDLALSHRKMCDDFVSDARIAAINDDLASKTGVVSDKTLSVAMDTTSRAGWESAVLPHLDSIPSTLVGKGVSGYRCVSRLSAEKEHTGLVSTVQPFAGGDRDRCSHRASHKQPALSGIGVDCAD